MTNKQLKVTVLMPVFNAMPFLIEASQSILTQTYKDFEFLIIEDGSTDGSYEYLRSLSDDRIRLVRQENNRGIGQSLQLGIELSTGAYILRMDADDIATPDRIQVQVNYLEQNPDIGLLGASYDCIDEKGIRIESIVKNETDLKIRWKCYFKNPFVHATVAIRREILERNNLNYPASLNQDYFLWTDILRFTKGRIIDSKVLSHRRHSRSLTQTKAEAKRQLQDGHAYKLFRELMGDALKKNEFSDFIDWYNKGLPYPFLMQLRYFKVALNMLKKFLITYNRNDAVPTLQFFTRESKKIFSKLSGNKVRKLFLKIPLLPNYYFSYLSFYSKISK